MRLSKLIAALCGSLCCGVCIAQPSKLAEVIVTADNTSITSSCRVVIPPGTVIADADGNGVIQISGDNITVEFADGSVLRGAEESKPWDQLAGTGIVIEGGRRVTLKGAKVHGFKVGIHARKTTALTIAGADVSDNFRQRLRSTPIAEDSTDWMFPHKNDDNEWMNTYGGGLVIEDSSQATIRNVMCRRGQNGIILDRVNDSKVYDNDCSFLSGWGLAMWRSSKNIVTRNAFDFCVRGHVEGVYNRGQDSAGILMFEQCSNNVIAENSATHGGDGFFGFAGHEAIGETPAPASFNHTRKGCNDNLIVGNDFSYASAHGLEMTFSHGNRILKNRFVENAICGIWGGYSQQTLIAQNEFTGNGGMAYGLERGAINIEHGSDNSIVENSFSNNKVAVHLWWDDDAGLLEKPGVKRNYKGVSGNVIAENEVKLNADHPFTNLDQNATLLAWQFRDVKPPQPDDAKQKNRRRVENFKNNQVSQNVVMIQGLNEADTPKAQESAFDPGTEPKTTGPTPKIQIPRYEVIGDSRPVGARSALAGRGKIVMDEWGPWDHQSPMIRVESVRGGRHVYQVLGAEKTPISATATGKGVVANVEPGDEEEPTRVVVSGGTGVTPYGLTISIGDSFRRETTAMLISARWQVTVFSWDDATDPRKDLDAWRKLAAPPGALAVSMADLSLRYGNGGPKDLRLSTPISNSTIGPDRFGTVATTRLALPKGTWRFWTLSDDGVRVTVNNRPLIENWTYHGPTRDTSEFVQEKDGAVDIRVEHFEIDGYSVLEFGIEQVK